MSIHIIGTITNSIPTDDPETVLTETLDGYHVASTEPITDWEAFETTHEAPPMEFYGVQTFYYKFDSEQHYKDVAGIVDESTVDEEGLNNEKCNCKRD
jgi:hypothetical protein